MATPDGEARPRNFVTPKGACNSTGLSLAALWRLIRSGDLPAYANGSRLVRLDAVERPGHACRSTTRRPLLLRPATCLDRGRVHPPSTQEGTA